jgi:DNA processing protein
MRVSGEKTGTRNLQPATLLRKNFMQSSDDAIIRSAIELTLIPGIGTITQNRIWNTLSNVESLFLSNNKLLESLGLAGDLCPVVRSRAYQAIAAEIYDWGLREGCRFLVRGMPGYPAQLQEIYDPPLVLYARGHTDILLQPCVAIVGTRKPTVYGLQMAQGLASDLGRRGITVVSGLARGIDSAAHRGCIQGTGATVAVLGSGIDVIYPRENRQLSEQIQENGLILSEFSPGTSPSPQNFPVRNRIISGLALGTLIIEASEYSGSLITARLSMEQNREVFAIPGNLTTSQSFGPNFLIKQGAKLIQSWRDIVEELPPELRQEIFIREDAKPPGKPELDLLSPEEIGILELLRMDEATQFDKIFRGSGVGISRLSSLLLDLEMGGWIRQLPGNMYVRIRNRRAES